MTVEKYKGIIFDFDFTLGDTTAGIENCIRYGLETLHQAQASQEEIRKTIGHSLSVTYEMLTNDTDPAHIDTFVRCFKERAEEVMTPSAILYPGVVEMLRMLKNKGLQTGVVTSKYNHRIQQILAKFAISDGIDAIVGADDVMHEKPDPEGLLQMLQKMQLEKEEVLYIGDSFVDAKAADGAEIDFVGVTTGTTARDKFQEYPHCMILDNVKELMQYFL